MPASNQHQFVYLEEERALVGATRSLAGVLGRRVTRKLDDELLQFASHYGVPIGPELVADGYRVSFADVRAELETFQDFEQRWRNVVAAAKRKRRLDTAITTTELDRERLASDMVRYLDERRVRVMFEASIEHVGLVTRITSGAPITAAVFRLAMGWASGGSERQLAPRQCATPGCPEVFAPSRRDQQYHSATCRKRATRARKVGS